MSPPDEAGTGREAGTGNAGFEALLRYPLMDALLHRRSRRIAKGIKVVEAGSLTYRSDEEPEPLTELEEAVLIAATGVTGLTMPDMPYRTESGKDLVGSPMVEVVGRAASSPDNAQATVFFLMNDEGTFLLRRPPDPVAPAGETLTAESLVEHAARSKVRILDHRLDFVRRFPCYLGRNRYVSNLPGTTLLLPVVDMTRQYINGIMYLLSQDEGQRPTFIDDWNFYRMAGCRPWVRRGFLNPAIKLPLGYLGTFRIHVEADLLVQNLLLVIQAMGLGGWVHGAFPGPILLGAPEYREVHGPGLGFRYAKPKFRLRSLLRPITPLPAWQANPVALGDLLKAYCPPNHADMPSAVDALLEAKYGPGGLYRTPGPFDEVFKPPHAETFTREVPHYHPDVVACTKDICSYIFDTYGRFPAHVDAFFVPGICVQAHHLDLAYYDALYRNGYTGAQAEHDRLWHGG